LWITDSGRRVVVYVSEGRVPGLVTEVICGLAGGVHPALWSVATSL